jgi:HAMP domain-containing protein
MRITLAKKTAASFFLITLSLCVGILVFFLNYANDNVLAAAKQRLSNIGHAGSFQITDSLRSELPEMLARITTEANFRSPHQSSLIRGDMEVVELLSPNQRKRIASSPEFQELIQELRSIQSSTTDSVSPIRPLRNNHWFADNPPSARNVYLLAPLSDHEIQDVMVFIGDAAHEGFEQPRSQSTSIETNIIGNLHLNPSNVFVDAYRTGEIVITDNWVIQDDRYWLRAGVPILSSRGEVIAILGIDYRARESQALIEELGNISLFVVVFSCVVAGFGGYLISKRGTEPLSRLVEYANRVDPASDSFNLSISRQDEFNDAAQAIREMLERLQAHYNEQTHRAEESSERYRRISEVLKERNEHLIATRKRLEEQLSMVLSCIDHHLIHGGEVVFERHHLEAALEAVNVILERDPVRRIEELGEQLHQLLEEDVERVSAEVVIRKKHA